MKTGTCLNLDMEFKQVKFIAMGENGGSQSWGRTGVKLFKQHISDRGVNSRSLLPFIRLKLMKTYCIKGQEEDQGLERSRKREGRRNEGRKKVGKKGEWESGRKLKFTGDKALSLNSEDCNQQQLLGNDITSS